MERSQVISTVTVLEPRLIQEPRHGTLQASIRTLAQRRLVWAAMSCAATAVTVLIVMSDLEAARGGAGPDSDWHQAAPAGADQGSPEPTSGVPNPDECRVQPRPVDELLDLVATPASSSLPKVRVIAGTPVVDYPPELPEGPVPDTTTVAAVRAVWRELYACYNAGDVLRQAALFSEAGVHRSFRGFRAGGLPPEVVNGTAVPASNRLAVPPLSAVRVLPGNRVGGLIDLGPPEAPEYAGKNHVVFVRVGDHWLIDEIVAIIG